MTINWNSRLSAPDKRATLKETVPIIGTIPAAKEGAPVIEPPLPLTSGRPPCTLPYAGNATTTRLKNVVHIHIRRADEDRTFANP